MNKAFVREPEETDPRCPGCGLLGAGVGRSTLETQLPLEALARISDSAWYCSNPRCTVGYFDALGQQIPQVMLKTHAYPKSPAGPVCCCHNIMPATIEQQARRSDPSQVKQLLAYAQSPQAQCSTTHPAAHSCVAEVQKFYLRASRRR